MKLVDRTRDQLLQHAMAYVIDIVAIFMIQANFGFRVKTFPQHVNKPNNTEKVKEWWCRLSPIKMFLTGNLVNIFVQ